MVASTRQERSEPRWALPDNPDLGWLRRRARELKRAADDPRHERHAEAIDLIQTFDPRLSHHAAEPAAVSLPLAHAQRVLARAYGFAGWPELRRRLNAITRFSRSPDPRGVQDSPADAMLRFGCLPYDVQDPADLERAAATLRADPSLADASVSTLAFCGRAEELTARLRSDPDSVNRDDGPHRWSPILYLCYGRLGLVAPDLAGDPVATLQVLLAAGADPDSGFLWHGLTSPFTALTGVFGGGERGESAHPQAVALAEQLLAAGADPNDNQTLYNRMFGAADDHLPPLLAAGLGVERPGPWRDRFGSSYPSATQMLGEHLRAAAERGFTARVRLLLAHGVDPNTRGYHPILGDQTAYEVAVRRGQAAAAALLARAGADDSRIDGLDRAAFAALTGEAPTRTGRHPDDGARLTARPELMAVAAEFHGVDALSRLLRLGLDVNAADRTGRTALHQAALDGDRALCDWLLDHGADAARTDRRFDATAAGWAAHAGHRRLAAVLQTAAETEQPKTG